MVSELRVYFEGDAALRHGFHNFLTEIVKTTKAKRCRFKLIATDGTPAQDFMDALRTHPGAWNVLILDSDGLVGETLEDMCRVKHIPPENADSVFWMVQVMESWFFADVNALKAYYGQHLLVGVVPGDKNVERIPKADVYSRLKRATNRSGPGEYHKTKHAPALLASIDPALVRAAAPNCERLFAQVLARL